jgi:O-antigen biosynthesis protein WbqP
MKRTLDVLLALFVLVVFAVPLIVLALMIKLTSRGPIVYWSARVGKNNRLFKMPKLRSLRIDTPQVATHLLTSPEQWYTPIGAFLRKSSLDELPQLWSILKGDMSFVGPRPALFNQADLIELRTQYGVHKLLPGITGWAQINGRDQITVLEKVERDVEYLQRRSVSYDLYIIWLTILAVLHKKDIAH